MEIKDDQLDSDPVRSMLSFQIDKTKEREAQEFKREILVKPTYLLLFIENHTFCKSYWGHTRLTGKLCNTMVSTTPTNPRKPE